MLIIQGEELNPDSSQHTEVSAKKDLLAQPISLWSLKMSALEEPIEMSEPKGWRAIARYLFRFVCFFSDVVWKAQVLIDLPLVTTNFRPTSTLHAHLRMWLVQRYRLQGGHLECDCTCLACCESRNVCCDPSPAPLFRSSCFLSTAAFTAHWL